MIHPAPGTYILMLASFPANSHNLVVNATLVAGPPAIETIQWFLNGMVDAIEVRTFRDGSPADHSFTIVCFDTTP